MAFFVHLCHLYTSRRPEALGRLFALSAAAAISREEPLATQVSQHKCVRWPISQGGTPSTGTMRPRGHAPDQDEARSSGTCPTVGSCLSANVERERHPSHVLGIGHPRPPCVGYCGWRRGVSHYTTCVISALGPVVVASRGGRDLRLISTLTGDAVPLLSPPTDESKRWRRAEASGGKGGASARVPSGADVLEAERRATCRFRFVGVDGPDAMIRHAEQRPRRTEPYPHPRAAWC